MPFDIKFHEIPEKIQYVEYHIRKIGQVIEQGKREAKFDIGSTSHSFKCFSVDSVVQLLNFELEELHEQLRELREIQSVLDKVASGLLAPKAKSEEF